MTSTFRINLSTCLFVLMIGFSYTMIAQTTGDYRSKASGNWGDNTTWQIFNGSSWINASGIPTGINNENVTIKTGHTVVYNGDWVEFVLNSLTIEIGAWLIDSTVPFVRFSAIQMNVYGTINMTLTTGNKFVSDNLIIHSTGNLTCRVLSYDIANNYGIARIVAEFTDTSNPSTPWVNQANSTLFIGSNFIGSSISASSVGNTVNYFNASNQNILAPIDSYYNLTLSGTGNKTLTSTISVLSNLSIADSAAFRLSSFNVSLAGDWNNSSSNGAAFVSGTGTVILNGNSTQHIINTGNASGTQINRLTIANTNTTTPQINMLADVTVGNTFTMTSGVINLNGRKFQLGTSNATATTLNHSVGWFYNGDFTRYFVTSATIPNGSNDGFFPVGTSSNFRPFYLSSTTALTGLPIATVTCPPSASTYSLVTIPDFTYTIGKVALSGWNLKLPDGAGGDFSVKAGGTGIGIIGNVNDLRLTQISSVAGTPGVNTGTPSSLLVERTGLTATDLVNTMFYVGSVNLTRSPLPVELISFSGEAEGTAVNLQWQTRSELNCDYFTVYRSRNGIDFVPVGTKKGRGTTNATTYYELQDARPLKGTNYYRLSQTDFDGTTQSLSLISVEANGVEAVQVYPNPIKSGEEVHLSLHGIAPAGEREIQLFNSIGQEVGKQKIVIDSDGSFTGKIKLNTVPPGMYFIRFNETKAKILVY